MERLRPVPRLVDALPQPFREAIVLHEIDDLSYSGNRPGDGGEPCRAGMRTRDAARG